MLISSDNFFHQVSKSVLGEMTKCWQMQSTWFVHASSLWLPLEPYITRIYFHSSSLGNGIAFKNNFCPLSNCFAAFILVFASRVFLTSIWTTVLRGSDMIRKSNSFSVPSLEFFSFQPFMMVVFWTFKLVNTSRSLLYSFSSSSAPPTVGSYGFRNDRSSSDCPFFFKTA